MVTFIRPTRTMAISVSGPHCELGCGHCAGRYLRSMLTPAEALLKAARDPQLTSALVSGGCNRQLQVLSGKHVQLLANLRQAGLRINAHSGLLSEQLAQKLAPEVDVFSVDYLSDRESATRVFGVDPGTGYRDTVSTLIALGARVVPHICMGLDPLAVGAEERALQDLFDLGCDRVVMLVFIPTPHTPSKGRQPPDPDRVREVLRGATAVFGNRVTLGCMRPPGRYRSEIDVLALECGVTAIVQPSPDAVAAVGDQVTWQEECCALC